MKNRANKGATLSLVVALTIVIALVGIGFIFLTFLFGGHREAEQAVDAGCLNIAKCALAATGTRAVNPNVSGALSSDIGLAFSANLSAPPNSNGTYYPNNMGQGVNLLNFNRFVGQALLVALNVDAEGGTGSQNARAAFDFVEGTAQSLGGQLQTVLKNGDSWAKPDYNEINGNVLRMLSSQGSPTYQSQDYQVGYMNQRPTDSDKGTNVDVSMYDPNNTAYQKGILPISDYNSETRVNFSSNAFTQMPSNQTTSVMAGYTPITTTGGKVPISFYGVPTSPGSQPHLASTSLFLQQTGQPGKGGVYLPPNAFRVGATAVLQKELTKNNVDNSAQAHVYSTSMIGTPNTPFPLSIPGGYLVIDNSANQTFNGTPPNTNNCAASELGSGILVDKTSGMFSYGPGPKDSKGNPTANLVDQWEAFPHNTGDATPTDPDKKAPPYQGKDTSGNDVNIFNDKGQPVTSANEAAKIPYNGANTLCTDNNSSQGGDALCQKLATSQVPPNNIDPFDQAYHPNTQSPSGSLSTSSATAAEMSSCEAISLYGDYPHGGGAPMLFSTAFGPTGIRFYSNGVPSRSNQYSWQGPTSGGFNMAPDAGTGGACVTKTGFNTGWQSVEPGACQVTEKATILDLFNQVNQMTQGKGSTNGASVKAAKQFLEQRMREIYPQVTQENMDAIIGPLPDPNSTSISSTGYRLDAGSGMKYYVYYTKNSSFNGGKPGLTIDQNGPVYLQQISNTSNNMPDGKEHKLYGTYNCLEGVTNPFFSYGIHDRLFTLWGTNPPSFDNQQGEITAYDTASFQPSSGAFGNLGVIKFQEYVMPGPMVAGFNGGPPPGFPPGGGPVNVQPPVTFNGRD